MSSRLRWSCIAAAHWKKYFSSTNIAAEKSISAAASTKLENAPARHTSEPLRTSVNRVFASCRLCFGSGFEDVLTRFRLRPTDRAGLGSDVGAGMRDETVRYGRWFSRGAMLVSRCLSSRRCTRRAAPEGAGFRTFTSGTELKWNDGEVSERAVCFCWQMWRGHSSGSCKFLLK